MHLAIHEEVIHKNRGKGGQVLLLRIDRDVPVQLKRKVALKNLDVEVGRIPRDDCFSRLENWRRLLKSEDGRRIRLFKDDDGEIVQADVLVSHDDQQEWDSPPLEWPGAGWVPFYLRCRPK